MMKAALAILLSASLMLPAIAPALAQHSPSQGDNRRRGDAHQAPRQDRQPTGEEIGLLIFGLTAAAIAAGAANEFKSRDEQRRYDRWVAYCSDRYRSFDPRTGMYRGPDGRRHQCR